MSEQIPRVNADDLRKVWEVFPLLQEQRAGGPSTKEMIAKLAPGADVMALIAHCAVLQHKTKRGEPINFEEAAKEIPLPVR